MSALPTNLFSSPFIVADREAMVALGQRVGSQLRQGDLVLLRGPLAAGKTTLTSGIGAALGVRGPVTSPTFVLARTHPSLGDGPQLIHVDAYRLSTAMELDDLDLDYDGAVSVVEWGDGLLDGARESWLTIDIAPPTGGDPLAEEAPRTVAVTAHGDRWSGVEL